MSWAVADSALYPLARVAPESGDYHIEPEFKVLMCSVCGCNYNHVGEPYTVAGEDDYRAGWGGRGDLVVVPFEGECGHEWEICFGFHKGETMAFVRHGPQFPPLLEGLK